MRLRVASCHGLLSLLINLITQGLTAEENEHDFRRTSSSSNLLMDAMREKYSYPKNEVTAGVGYGHHLNPFYYQGGKEMMYPCAVECGEWEAMKLNDNSNDASSNVDVVTVHPDVSTIDITTTKSRPYKDISFLRPKKYQSSLFSGISTTSTPKSTGPKDFAYQDSKGADIQIIPQMSDSRYQMENSNVDKEIPNDGSLYGKYYDALVSGYDRELNTDNTDDKENEHFDPMEESLRYNPPSFNDSENDDIDAPVYPTEHNSYPERERIEEKYVKHNVREERLEDVRTNSFGRFKGGEDHSSDSNSGKQSSGFNYPKYIDDYAAPINPHYHSKQNDHSEKYKGGFTGYGDVKPFRSSSPQGQAFQNRGKRPPFYSGRYRGQNKKLRPATNIPYQDSNNDSYYTAADYNVEGGSDYDEDSPSKSGAYFDQIKDHRDYNIKQGRNYSKKYPYRKVPGLRIIRRPPIYGRNSKYPQSITGNGKPWNYPSQPYQDSHLIVKSLHSEQSAGHSHNPYAPRHEYSLGSQEYPIRSSSGGIRVVPPPRIKGHLPRHGKFSHYAKDVPTVPYVREQRIGFKRTIPQANGFIKVVKKFTTFLDHTPKRYVRSGQPYVSL